MGETGLVSIPYPLFQPARTHMTQLWKRFCVISYEDSLNEFLPVSPFVISFTD